MVASFPDPITPVTEPTETTAAPQTEVIVAPADVAVASVNDPVVPDGWLALYEPDGTEHLVRGEDAARSAAKYGWLAERYDVDAAVTETVAYLDAAKEAILKVWAATTTRGYLENVEGFVLNEAMGKVRDGFHTIAKAYGARYPMEDQIASIAAHIEQNGNANAINPKPEHEALARAFIQNNPQNSTAPSPTEQSDPEPARDDVAPAAGEPNE